MFRDIVCQDVAVQSEVVCENWQRTRWSQEQGTSSVHAHLVRHGQSKSRIPPNLLENGVDVIFSVARTDISRTTTLFSVCARVLPSAVMTE